MLIVSKKYHRLCAECRKVIANMKQTGRTQSEIAQAIGFSQSAISKELSSNHGERGYQPAQAERLDEEAADGRDVGVTVSGGIEHHAGDVLEQRFGGIGFHGL